MGSVASRDDEAVGTRGGGAGTSKSSRMWVPVMVWASKSMLVDVVAGAALHVPKMVRMVEVEAVVEDISSNVAMLSRLMLRASRAKCRRLSGSLEAE